MVAGFFLSLVGFLNLEWLSRAGCVIVILGIWSGLGGIIQERVLLGRLQVRRRMTLARTRRQLRRHGADADAIAGEFEAIDKDFAQRAAALTEQLRLSLGILEVSLLITGTFLWGFGDIIVLILKP